MEANTLVVVGCDQSAIADEINSLHKQAMENVASAAEIAAEIGSRLSQIKEQVGYGNFQQWIADNCDFSLKQAERYMKLGESTRESILHNSSIRKALAAIASDPTKETTAKDERVSPKRGRPWSEILESFSKRKRVSFQEIAESVGMKNDEKVRRYASQWEDASGLVIEKNGDGVTIKSGGDAVVSIFEQLPPKTKQNVLQKLHLDEEVVEKKLTEFKRNNQKVGDHVSGVLYKVHDLLHGFVQQYRNKEHVLRSVTEEQSNDLIRVQSSIESLVTSIQQILIEGCSNGVSKK